jgi:asparagine synthase (glutamine-hydrolysing)
MCGIAGIVWQDPARPGDARAVRAMTRALAHRGPDGEGVEAIGPAALGHRRLAVIDLSDDARQPMANEDGTVWLTFNGEVYGHVALRAALEAKGHTLRSRCDAEVVLHLYAEHGAECLSYLRGMFAFALWDAREQRLLLARDRAGQKPLHYRVDHEALRFASEPGGLLADPTAPAPEADAEALLHYLHYGYVPSPLSAFKGWRKLPPAHLLDWRPGRPPLLTRYWRPQAGPKLAARTTRDRAALVDELAARVDEAVGLRLVSDVPLGAFLSGGIDSGLVVASMARALRDPVQTFTIGFEEAVYDERERARAVAERWGTQHREQIVPADALELLPLLLRRYGEPFADSSCLPTYRVSELARRHVTVALSGDGGDEQLAGYLRHTANKLGAVMDAVPGPLRLALREAVERVPLKARPHVDPLRYARRFLRASELDVATRNAEWGMMVKPETGRLLAGDDLRDLLDHVDPADAYRAHFRAAPGTSVGERALWADFAQYLPDDILVKVDVASMCHGLEARAPLLDHVLVEWLLRVPFAAKHRWGESKWIARRLADRRLPKSVARGPKRGFSIPLDAWFRGPLLPLFRETVLAPDARTRGLIDRVALETLLEQHLARRWAWHSELWVVLWLELWFREVLEPAQAARPCPVD